MKNHLIFFSAVFLMAATAAKADIFNVEFNQSNWMLLSQCLTQAVQDDLPNHGMAGYTFGALANGVVSVKPHSQNIMNFYARFFPPSGARIDGTLQLISTGGDWLKSSSGGFPGPSLWSTRTSSMSNLAHILDNSGRELFVVDVSVCWES